MIRETKINVSDLLDTPSTRHVQNYCGTEWKCPSLSGIAKSCHPKLMSVLIVWAILENICISEY